MNPINKLMGWLKGKKRYEIPLSPPDEPSQLTTAKLKRAHRIAMAYGAFGKAKSPKLKEPKLRPRKRPSRPAIYVVPGGKARSKYMPHVGKKQLAKVSA